MKAVMITAFVNMIKAGTVTLEDIPEEYREAVTERMAASTVTNADVQKDGSPFGALFLGKQEIEVEIDHTGNPACNIFISNEDVFKDHLDDNVMPEGILYSVLMVENTFGKFETIPRVILDSTSNGFNLQVMAAPSINISSGSKLLRIDVMIESENYEDMIQTIYLIAK